MYWREHKSQWSENSIRNYKHKPDSIRVYEEFSKNHNDLHSRYLKKYKFRILFYNSIKLNELGMFKDSNEFIYSEIIKSCSSSVIMNIKFLPLMIFNFFELRVSIKLLKNIKNYLSN